jgi:hypothetical protein
MSTTAIVTHTSSLNAATNILCNVNSAGIDWIGDGIHTSWLGTMVMNRKPWPLARN